jgi:hypothetical protein
MPRMDRMRMARGNMVSLTVRQPGAWPEQVC